jgi:hypothetical protein
MARVNLFKHVACEHGVKSASPFIRQRRFAADAPAPLKDLPKQRANVDTVAELRESPANRFVLPVLASPLARAGFDSLPKMLANCATPRSQASPSKPPSNKMFKRRLTKADIDHELDVLLQTDLFCDSASHCKSTLGSNHQEASQPLEGEKSTSLPKCNAATKHLTRDELFREQQEDLERHLHQKKISAEFLKAKGDWQLSDVNKQTNRVQQKLKRLEALQNELAPLPKICASKPAC